MQAIFVMAKAKLVFHHYSYDIVSYFYILVCCLFKFLNFRFLDWKCILRFVLFIVFNILSPLKFYVYHLNKVMNGTFGQ